MLNNARNTALTIICDITTDKVPSHIAIDRELERVPDMSAEDRSFVKKLVAGTIENIILLDSIINDHSSVKAEKQKPLIRNILRMGVYQILYLNVPDSAACNEAVKLAKKRGFAGLSGFVNGVLRNITKNKDGILAGIAGIDSVNAGGMPADNASFSKKYSLPEWIVAYYRDRFGDEKAEAAFEYFLRESTTQIRCNISKTEPEKLAARLKEKGITVKETGNGIAKCMTISGYGRLYDIEEFREGLFCVQDLSSVLAGEIPDRNAISGYLAEKKENGAGTDSTLQVLDICAAPGGKTLNMADRLKAEGFEASFTSCDVSEAKLNKIKENIDRCGFDNITCRKSDGTVHEPGFDDRFDIVIADVPCSGLGVIGRKPDIKLNASPEKIKELADLQKSILGNAVRYVKSGGFMIFSTCTVGTAENEDNAAYIEQQGFKCTKAVQICPGEYDCDGFFYALLRKV